jgi:hypothetical protein
MASPRTFPLPARQIAPTGSGAAPDGGSGGSLDPFADPNAGKGGGGGSAPGRGKGQTGFGAGGGPSGPTGGAIGTPGSLDYHPSPLSIPTAVVTPYDAPAWWAAKRLVGIGPLMDARMPAIATLKGNLPPNSKALPWGIIPDAFGNAWFCISDGYQWQSDGTDGSQDAHDAWSDSSSQIMLNNSWRDGNGTDAGIGVAATTFGGSLTLNWNVARAFDYDKVKLSFPSHPELVLTGPDYQTGVVQNGSGQFGIVYPAAGIYGKGAEPRISQLSGVLFALPAEDGSKIGMLAIGNRWTRTCYFTQALGAPTSSDDYTNWSSVLSTAGTGASIGTLILPGVGTLIGAAIGAIALAQAQSAFHDKLLQAEAIEFARAPDVLGGSAPFSSMAATYGLQGEPTRGGGAPGGAPGAPGAPGSGGFSVGSNLLPLALAGIGLYLVIKE